MSSNVVSPKPAKPKERAHKRNTKGSWLLVVPAAVIVLVFGLYPVLALLRNSFGLGDVGMHEEAGFTFAYYLEAFQVPRIRAALINSILVAGGAVVITVVFAIPLVLHLARQSRSGKSTAFADALLTFPIVLPGIIIGFFSIVLIGRNSLLGNIFEPLSGLAYTYIGLYVAYVFFSIPRVISPLRGAAEMMDPELEEAALSLGASKTRVFWTVTLPLILPAAIEVAGTAAAVALGGYGTVAALSQGIRLLPLDVVDALNNGYNIATASAFAVILAILTILCLVLGQVLSRAVKGAFR